MGDHEEHEITHKQTAVAEGGMAFKGPPLNQLLTSYEPSHLSLWGCWPRTCISFFR